MPVLADEERPAAAWAAHAAKLKREGLIGAAILAEARAWAGGEDVAPVAEAASTAAADDAEAAVAKLERFGEADLGERVARLADGLAAGGDRARLLLGSARRLLDEGRPIAAAELAAGARRWLERTGEPYPALATDPEALLEAFPEVEAWIARGRLERARDAARALASRNGVAPHLLRRASVLLTTFEQPFDFRAADYLAGDPDDDATPSSRSLIDAQETLRLIAGRVSAVAQSLGRTDLPGLAELDGRPSPLELPDASHERRSLLRAEWARLSWAIAALGGTRIGPVAAVVRPRCAMDFVDTFLTARHDLLFDVAEGNAPVVKDALDQQLLEATWGGATLASLDAPLAQVWLDETEAALAGLRWGMGLTAAPWSVDE